MPSTNSWASMPFQVRNGVREGSAVTRAPRGPDEIRPLQARGAGSRRHLHFHVPLADRADRDVVVEGDELALAAWLVGALRLLLERPQHLLGRNRAVGDPDADRVVD